MSVNPCSNHASINFSYLDLSLLFFRFPISIRIKYSKEMNVLLGGTNRRLWFPKILNTCSSSIRHEAVHRTVGVDVEGAPNVTQECVLDLCSERERERERKRWHKRSWPLELYLRHDKTEPRMTFVQSFKYTSWKGNRTRARVSLSLTIRFPLTVKFVTRVSFPSHKDTVHCHRYRRIIRGRNWMEPRRVKNDPSGSSFIQNFFQRLCLH